MTIPRIAIVCGVAGVGLVVGLRSRWGPKSRAAIKEFYRPAYNLPPPDWKGSTFKPNLDFPTECPPAEEYPWDKIDFEKEPEKYLHAVVEYCFDGNLENDFVTQKNPKRKWFHAPWMTQTPLGREPMHGLTYERPAPPGYLAETQQRVVQVWAVGMHNETAAVTFGKLWKRQYEPDPTNVKFPLGSISFKLIFCEATSDDVPFLEGNPKWKATISRKPLPYPSKERTPPTELGLVQVDIAVRDARADKTGWLFGTFMYHNSVQDENPWKRLMPISLMWGNDPDLTPEKYEKGDRPKESWVNPKAVATLPKTRPYFGWLGRGNGLIDNFKSSCMSCHSTANHPTHPMFPWGESLIEQVMLWFRNIKAGENFGSSGHPLDYSLQMNVGLENYARWSQHWVPHFAPVYRSTRFSEFPENKKLAGISDYSPEHIKHVTPEKK